MKNSGKIKCPKCKKEVDAIHGKKIAPHRNGINRCNGSGLRLKQLKE